MGAKYRLTTLGCKVNQYETQAVRQALESAGIEPAAAHETADWAVINTCAVTGAAQRKSRQAVRRAAREGARRVVVIGCGATAEAGRFRAIPGVTSVFTHADDVRRDIARLLAEPAQLSAENEAGRPPESTSDHGGDAGAAGSAATTRLMHRSAERNDGWMRPAASMQLTAMTEVENHRHARWSIPTALPIVKRADQLNVRIDRFDGHQRAFLKVQDGCDAFCSYCIIPRLRPELRWKPVDLAVAEAGRLVESGHREIILTGIFLGAYGRDTAHRRRFSPGASPLAELVDAVARVPGLERLRLSSLEPGDVDAALLEVLTRRPACVPHLHLPLQSGSATILKRMNRQYTVDEFYEMIDRTRTALDRPAISTDIIVGFPGESDADFEASVAAVRYAGFCKIHAFPFSARQHTAAARWSKDFVPAGLVRRRMEALADLEAELSMAFRRRFIGQVERVIVEDDRDAEDDFVPRAHAAGGTGGLSASARDDRLGGHDEPVPGFCSGRADRYFRVHFSDDDAEPGDLAWVRIDRVSPMRTHGTRIRSGPRGFSLPVLSGATR